MDRGYRSHAVTKSQVFISSQKRGLNTRLKFLLKQIQAIEPMVGRIKHDRMLDRNYLKEEPKATR